MNLNKDNDYELIYYISQGDDEAFCQLLKKYNNLLLHSATFYFQKYRYIGVSFEDLYQESQIGFVNALKSFNDDISLFPSYAKLCIENNLKTYCRNYNNLKNYPLNFSVCEESVDYCVGYYDENILEENERFFESKNLLNFKLSIVYELRYNGFSYNEISKLLDLAFSTVDGRISMIKKILKDAKL